MGTGLVSDRRCTMPSGDRGSASKLVAGNRLGVYEILSLLGRGGMGEVYRARDTKLGREVAIKVLPEGVVPSSERAARLEGEARALASLNHPHIATLYGFDREGDTAFLVMEMVEGERLEERLEREPLPLAEALVLGSQIAEALERAHRQGIVHRDLKPGNVMLTRDGAKLLDFGIAKHFARTAQPDDRAPTLPAPLTDEGVVVGTPRYMAPEQVQGKEVDARTDIFALGAVLYEMITGRPAFAGENRASLVASILRSEPPPMEVASGTGERPASTSALRRLEWAIRRCLAKDPEERWQSAHDVFLELERAKAELEEDAPVAESARRPGWSRVLPWTLGAIAAAGLGAAVAFVLRPAPAEPSSGSGTATAPTTRFAVAPSVPILDMPTLSPDGTLLAYLAGESLQNLEIWLRPLDGLESTVVAGTRGARDLAFSPDGRSIAFTVCDRLYRLAVAGGSPIPLARGAAGTGLAWGEDGYLYYQAAEGHSLWRAPEDGGEAAAVGAFADDEHFATPACYAVEVAPGGRGLLCGQDPDSASEYFQELAVHDLRTGESRRLGVLGFGPRFVPPRFVVFRRDRVLYAVPFDLERLAIAGRPLPVEHDVATSPQWSSDIGFHGVSRRGDLAFLGGQSQGRLAELVWVHRDGTAKLLTAEPRDYANFLLSPDARTLSIAVYVESGPQLWLLDLDTLAWTMPGQSGTYNSVAIWTRDGRYLTFLSNREGDDLDLFHQPADLSRAAQRLLAAPATQVMFDWSPEGRYLLFEDFRKPGIWLYDRETKDVTPPEDGQAVVRPAEFHRNGRWIVYAEHREGESTQIWIRPFPGPGAPRQITVTGGQEPHWSRDGEELFFRSETHMMSIPVAERAGELVLGRPRPLFEDPYLHHRNPGYPHYEVHPDGRFLMAREHSSPSGGRIVVVQNLLPRLGELFRE
jgi:eukaryotic-like serine/threonine-protein kinase